MEPAREAYQVGTPVKNGKSLLEHFSLRRILCWGGISEKCCGLPGRVPWTIGSDKTQNKHVKMFRTPLAGQPSHGRTPPVPGTNGTKWQFYCVIKQKRPVCPRDDLGLPCLSQGRFLFVLNTVPPEMFICLVSSVRNKGSAKKRVLEAVPLHALQRRASLLPALFLALTGNARRTFLPAHPFGLEGH